MEQAESNMTTVGMYVLSSNALPAMKALYWTRENKNWRAKHMFHHPF